MVAGIRSMFEVRKKLLPAALAVFVMSLRTQCSISRNEIDGQHRL